MFSSITMASSTTKPTLSVSAMSERLSRLKPNRYITENVPAIESGRARLGMSVAETLRRNRKITSTTSVRASSSENCTSSTEARTDSERSYMISMDSPAGACARKVGSSRLIESTISMVLVPGWRWMASSTPRVSLNQAASLSFCTLSMTRPISARRTGAPLRYATTIVRKAFAFASWPLASTVQARCAP